MVFLHDNCVLDQGIAMVLVYNNCFKFRNGPGFITYDNYVLDPGMAMDMELSITGPEPGKIDHTLYCHVMNLEEPLHLHVQAEFKVFLH